ncbi:MAG TPA: DUF899 family protein [Bryobacteraceae bacterium]|nr:DUF899 family protein [Bryobacteraceae bacterium]
MPNLIPAQQLAANNKTRFPNESEEYRAARNSLLASEIELRRHLEQIAEQRRALPPGGPIPRDFVFSGPGGPAQLSTLFGDKDTLLIYSMMFGPKRAAACPSCTSFLTSWNGTAVNLRERVAMAVTARSPIERLTEFQKQRALTNLPFVSDESGDYTRTYVNPDDADMPGFSVFTRGDGMIRHFYSGEISFEMSDPGQDPRGAPDADPLWQMLDYTPEGRGTDWYPKLDYGHK